MKYWINYSGGLRPPMGNDPTLIERRYNLKNGAPNNPRTNRVGPSGGVCNFFLPKLDVAWLLNKTFPFYVSAFRF